MAIYLGNPRKPAPELSETLTQLYTILTVLKFFTSTPPNLPFQASQSTSRV